MKHRAADAVPYRDRLRIPSERDPVLAAVVLVALVAIAAAPLAQVTWFDTHEGIAAWERVLAISSEIRAGYLYPRWLSAAYAGKGSPFADFYSPAVHHGAAWLHVAGLPIFSAIKSICAAALAIGALGALLWTRRHVGLAGAVVASALYLLAPYHYVDLFVRGAYSEFAALALLPWLFLGLDLCGIEALRRRGVVTVALATAGIVLTHNLSAVMIAPFAAAYVVWSSVASANRGSTLGSVAAGVTMGVGLSSFYWLPVLLEASGLKGLASTLTTGAMMPESHFVEPAQLLDPKWGFGISVPGANDGMSFQLGLVQAAAGAVGVLTLARGRGRTLSFGWVMLGLLVWAVLMTTSAALFVYARVTPLRFVQFPWRFLGPASLFLAAFGGILAAERTASPLHRWRWPIAGLVAVACVIASSTFRQPRAFANAAAYEAPDAEERVLSGGLMGALTVSGEYVPRWVSARAVAARVPPVPVAIGEGSRIHAFVSAGASGRFTVEAGGSGATVLVPWFYFPGWDATVDGVHAEVAPSPDGFLSIGVAPGRHEVRLRVGSTPARTAGAWVTSASALALALTWLWGARLRRTAASAIAAGAAEAAADQDG